MAQFGHLYHKLVRASEIVADDGAVALAHKARQLARRVLNREESLLSWLCSGSECTEDYDDIVWATEMTPLDFKLPLQPNTSIVIPVFNKARYTFNCLKSILENTQIANYEVIVVDDGSTDETPVMLSKMTNIKVVRNSPNRGFLFSCHEGARVASGRNLLFLNNDTQVRRNWLEALTETLERDLGIGLVGAKLIYPDGTLQEAGGIIWSDASGCNYGRGDYPGKSEYEYVREVDYCSGACILLRRTIWDQLGGFDTQYAPAYYEDSDLAFGVRQAGFKVVYQPAAEVIHYEGISHGTTITTGVKKFQVINQEKFKEKWRRVLTTQHRDPDEALLLARDRRRGKHVLVVDHEVPAFDRDSGSLRMFHLLRLLAEMGYVITFVPMSLAKREPYTSQLQQMGIEVVYRSRPWQYLSELGPHLDLVILSRPGTAKKYLRRLRRFAPRAKFIYDTVDLYFLREARRASLEKNRRRQRMAANYKSMELSAAAASDATFVVSTVEKDLLSKEIPGIKIHVIANVHERRSLVMPFDGRKDLLFVGSFGHPPNVDGISHFVEEIFPIVRRSLPGVKLYIVGDAPTTSVQALACSDIIVTGWVEDLGPFFEAARVFVAPLRYGAGVKGKIGQSLSYGLPVVTTSIGAEGMSLIDGENILIADSPQEFSLKVTQLYNNAVLWQQMSENSMDYIDAHSSPTVIGAKLQTVLAELMEPCPDAIAQL